MYTSNVASMLFHSFLSLSPFSYDSRAVEDGNLAGMQDFVPLGAIALFASSSAEYQDHVNTTISRANSVYHEFLNSPEGRGFTGQVSELCVSACFNKFKLSGSFFIIFLFLFLEFFCFIVLVFS